MIKKIIVLIALVYMLTLNMLAVLLPLNGLTTKELSDAIPSFFVPAGYVFSVWSLIYVALIAYAVYQILSRNKENKKLHSISWLFVINAFANGCWMIFWHYQYVALSVVVMLIILVTLIIIYKQLGIGKIEVNKMDYWFTHFPFSLYLGWISVATIANISAALVVHNWSGWGIEPQAWSAAMIIVATIITILMLVCYRDYTFAAVILWAFIGIAVNYTNEPIIYWAAIICIASEVLVTIIVPIIRTKSSLIKKRTV